MCGEAYFSVEYGDWGIYTRVGPGIWGTCVLLGSSERQIGLSQSMTTPGLAGRPICVIDLWARHRLRLMYAKDKNVYHLVIAQIWMEPDFGRKTQQPTSKV